MKKRLSILFICSLGISALEVMGTAVVADDFTLTTYHPAPVGIYDQVRLVPRSALADPCQIGFLHVDNSDNLLRFCFDDGAGIGYGL